MPFAGSLHGIRIGGFLARKRIYKGHLVGILREQLELTRLIWLNFNSGHLQTTSGEDVRDFTRLLRNKLLSSKKKKSSRLGYLPVQNLEPETPDSPSLSPGRSVSRQVRENYQNYR